MPKKYTNKQVWKLLDHLELDPSILLTTDELDKAKNDESYDSSESSDMSRDSSESSEGVDEKDIPNDPKCRYETRIRDPAADSATDSDGVVTPKKKLDFELPRLWDNNDGKSQKLTRKKLKTKKRVRHRKPPKEEGIAEIPELNSKIKSWSRGFFRQLEKNENYDPLGGNISHMGLTDNYDDSSDSDSSAAYSTDVSNPTASSDSSSSSESSHATSGEDSGNEKAGEERQKAYVAKPGKPCSESEDETEGPSRKSTKKTDRIQKLVKRANQPRSKRVVNVEQRKSKKSDKEFSMNDVYDIVRRIKNENDEDDYDDYDNYDDYDSKYEYDEMSDDNDSDYEYESGAPLYADDYDEENDQTMDYGDFDITVNNDDVNARVKNMYKKLGESGNPFNVIKNGVESAWHEIKTFLF